MIISRLLNQTAVYWAPGTPGADGNPSYSDGVDVAVRWQFKKEVVTNAAGEKITSMAQIYNDTASETLAENGRLYQGSISDLTPAQIADPNQVDRAWQIKVAAESPSIDASQALGKTWL